MGEYASLCGKSQTWPSLRQDGNGRRLTLYVRTDPENRDTAFRYAQEGKVGVFYWLDHKVGYALSGELPRDELLSIAETAYAQLNAGN
jgi:anti-sigma factor RsiW